MNTTITCSICNKTYNEADVNIVDYEDDVCTNCEKTYKTNEVVDTLETKCDNCGTTISSITYYDTGGLCLNCAQ